MCVGLGVGVCGFGSGCVWVWVCVFVDLGVGVNAQCKCVWGGRVVRVSARACEQLHMTTYYYYMARHD